MQLLTVERQRDAKPAHVLVTTIHHATRDRDPLAPVRYLLAHGDERQGDVCGLAAGQIYGCDDRAARETYVADAIPPGALEIGDQHHLAHRLLRLRNDSPGELYRGTVSGGPRGRRGGIYGVLETQNVGAGLSRRLGALVE